MFERGVQVLSWEKDGCVMRRRGYIVHDGLDHPPVRLAFKMYKSCLWEMQVYAGHYAAIINR